MHNIIRLNMSVFTLNHSVMRLNQLQISILHLEPGVSGNRTDFHTGLTTEELNASGPGALPVPSLAVSWKLPVEEQMPLISSVEIVASLAIPRHSPS